MSRIVRARSGVQQLGQGSGGLGGAGRAGDVLAQLGDLDPDRAAPVGGVEVDHGAPELSTFGLSNERIRLATDPAGPAA